MKTSKIKAIERKLSRKESKAILRDFLFAFGVTTKKSDSIKDLSRGVYKIAQWNHNEFARLKHPTLSPDDDFFKSNDFQRDALINLSNIAEEKGFSPVRNFNIGSTWKNMKTAFINTNNAPGLVLETLQGKRTAEETVKNLAVDPAKVSLDTGVASENVGRAIGQTVYGSNIVQAIPVIGQAASYGEMFENWKVNTMNKAANKANINEDIEYRTDYSLEDSTTNLSDTVQSLKDGYNVPVKDGDIDPELMLMESQIEAGEIQAISDDKKQDKALLYSGALAAILTALNAVA